MKIINFLHPKSSKNKINNSEIPSTIIFKEFDVANVVHSVYTPGFAPLRKIVNNEPEVQKKKLNKKLNKNY